MVVLQIRYLVVALIITSNLSLNALDHTGFISWLNQTEHVLKRAVHTTDKRIKRLVENDCFKTQTIQKLSDHTYLAAFALYLAYAAKHDIDVVSFDGLKSALVFGFCGIFAKRIIQDLVDLSSLHAQACNDDFIEGKPCSCPSQIAPLKNISDVTPPQEQIAEQVQEIIQVIAPVVESTPADVIVIEVVPAETSSTAICERVEEEMVCADTL